MTDLSPASSSTWDRARAASAIFASVVIPLAIALAGHWYAQAIKEREIRLRYVELSIQILSAPATDGTLGMRKWAVKVINRFSEVKIDEQTEQQLLFEQLRLMIDRDNEEGKRRIQSIGR